MSEKRTDWSSNWFLLGHRIFHSNANGNFVSRTMLTYWDYHLKRNLPLDVISWFCFQIKIDRSQFINIFHWECRSKFLIRWRFCKEFWRLRCVNLNNLKSENTDTHEPTSQLLPQLICTKTSTFARFQLIKIRLLSKTAECPYIQSSMLEYIINKTRRLRNQDCQRIYLPFI